jgi:hypothetical protein
MGREMARLPPGPRARLGDAAPLPAAAMTGLEHDGAASLAVLHLAAVRTGTGWYVVRTGPCHRGLPITVPFDDREAAERALAVLDEDARRRHGAPPSTPPIGP